MAQETVVQLARSSAMANREPNVFQSQNNGAVIVCWETVICIHHTLDLYQQFTEH